MNNIISNIQQLEQSTFENLRNSKAKNTSRAYSADYKDFVCFCKRYNFPFMPSNPKTITLYLTHLGENFKYSTIKRRLSTIKIMHKFKGFHLDLNHPIIKENCIFCKSKQNLYNLRYKL